MSDQRKRIPAEEGIDILELFGKLWAGRKIIILFVCAGLAVGLVAAITMKHRYTVTSVLVPQTNSRYGTSLSSIAGLAGFDLGLASSSSSEISPLTYPQIVGSVPFRRELLYAPLHFEKSDTTVCLLNYFRDYQKPSFFDKVQKYTIGLPRTIWGAVKPKKEPRVFSDSLAVASPSSSDEIKPIVLTKEEENLMGYVGQSVKLTVEKKEGYLTLTVEGMEPRETADLAAKSLELLQDELTRFRTEKAQKELEYLQARHAEVKRETEACQVALANVMDRSKGVATTSAKIEQERIQSKYVVVNAIYAELSKQLEQAKLRVKKDTPVLAVIQPPSVPNRPSTSRARTLIIWVFLFGVLGCAWVLGKEALPKIKGAFSGKPTE